MSDDKQQKKPRAAGGSRYPFINLQKALERCAQFRAAAGDHAILATDARVAWGYGAKSSGGDQTIAALRYYGLLERDGAGKVRLTDGAKRYLRDERPETQAALRQQFAFQPRVMRQLWGDWKTDPPPDPSARSILKVDLGFPDNSAAEVLRIYKQNIAFVGMPASATLPAVAATSEGQNGGEEEDESPPAAVKVGDYVQWRSNGVEQFTQPRRVDWVSEDGSHIRVFGSMTGIPVDDTTVTEAPKPPALGGMAAAAAVQNVGRQAKDINVLLTGDRLQITADVDAAGLATLKQMLDKYEEILKLLG